MTYPRTSSAFGRAADTAAVTPSPRFPEIEREVLAFWEADDTFRASIAQRDGAEEWVFYDGPPFANGLPHYGHLLTGYAKDLFPRFQTMLGKKVDRVFGWDTHGLPAELEAMKQLGITEKDEIEQMGIDVFNAKARESVLAYTHEWQDYVTRQARWVDFERGYKTLDLGYMESVLWAFKTLHDKGLAYEGYRVLPYCWRDETPLSAHELRMDDDVYKERQDPSVTVSFPLTGEKAAALGLEGVRALAWTTTPWTLPTNLALAVGPEIVYAVVPVGPNGASEGAQGDRFLLAQDLLGGYAKDLGYDSPGDALAAVTAHRHGRRARRRDLRPPLRLLRRRRDLGHRERLADPRRRLRHHERRHRHRAPGARLRRGRPARRRRRRDPHDPVARRGRTLPAAGGRRRRAAVDGREHAARAPAARERPAAAAAELPALLPALLALPEPPHLQGRLQLVRAGHGVQGPRCSRTTSRSPGCRRTSSTASSASGSRARATGRSAATGTGDPRSRSGRATTRSTRAWTRTDPSPTWSATSGACRATPTARSTCTVRSSTSSPGRTRTTPPARSTMRRIEDVFDVWFDSGSMPFAQVHYPFENQEWFDSHSPADFIVEYIGQTRGWFYLMHVLSTALFDRPAFTGVSCHGIVLGSDGYKMSKSLRNYPDVSEVFDRDGSDAMRWFLMSSSVLRGGNLSVTEEGIRAGVREFLLPLWSSWYFFATYANASTGSGTGGYEAQWRTDSTDVLDRYILARTGDLVRGVQEDLEGLDSTTAAARLRDFAEVLTNWYVRRSRDRFWVGVDASTAQRPALRQAPGQAPRRSTRSTPCSRR